MKLVRRTAVFLNERFFFREEYPRTYAGSDDYIGDLAKDIEKHGLIIPVTLLSLGNTGYVVLSGVRRIKACRKLGFTTIDADIYSDVNVDEVNQRIIDD
jgi:ParB family chromosome partitioning protein